MTSLYETDFYSWSEEQAAALRAAARTRVNLPLAVDWENLAEEVEDMGRSRLDELYSRHVRLLQHLLKWQFQPDGRGGSWRGTITEQRQRIDRLLAKNPGVKPRHAELFAEAWADARQLALDETGLDPDHLPATCPYSLKQATDRDFWPE